MTNLLKAVEGLLSTDIWGEQLHELGAGVGLVGGAVRVEHVAHDQHCKYTPSSSATAFDCNPTSGEEPNEMITIQLPVKSQRI